MLARRWEPSALKKPVINNKRYVCDMEATRFAGSFVPLGPKRSRSDREAVAFWPRSGRVPGAAADDERPLERSYTGRRAMSGRVLPHKSPDFKNPDEF